MKTQISTALFLSMTLIPSAFADLAADQAKVRADQTVVKSTYHEVKADQQVRAQDQQQVRADREKLRADLAGGVDRATIAADREKLTAARAARDQAVLKVRADKATLNQARVQRATDRQARHADQGAAQ